MDSLSYFATQERLDAVDHSIENHLVTYINDTNRKHVTFSDAPAIVVQEDNDNTGPSGNR